MCARTDAGDGVQRRARRMSSTEYLIVDLGVLPGGGFSEALNVNDRGQIVGWGGTASGEMHAILWDNGEPIDLGTLGGAMSRAWGINNRGQVVGESETAKGDFHAFLWEDGQMIDLAEAGPFNRAFSINHKTEVVGHFQLDAVLWSRGTLTDLGIGSALAINDRGVIAGSDKSGGRVARGAIEERRSHRSGHAARRLHECWTVGQQPRASCRRVAGETTGTRAFLWQNGEISELTGLIPIGANFGRDINNHGLAVGESMSNPNVGGGAPRGVLWINGGAPINLGALEGDGVSSAAAINDRGLIVGFSGEGGFDARAVAWVPQR